MIEHIENIFQRQQSGQVYRKVIDDAERILIEKALERTAGEQFSAAQLLGINRNTLRSKIRKLNIDTKRFRL